MIDGVINTPYSLILIAVMAAVTAFVRFSPFILFPEGRKRPRVITYLGKGKSLIEYPYCIPELLAAALVVGLHVWKRNTLISVFAGVAFYMVLVQLVF